MRVLVSAYACQPHRGSEHEIGWQWARHIALLGHEVWVLTRAACREDIETELARSPIHNLRFVYYDLPKPLREGRRQWSIYAYYALWQWYAARFARKIHARQAFDRVHHVTWGGLRVPSFMGSLGIPLILGPVGGGERAPWRLWSGYGLRGWALHLLRDIANSAIRFNPLILRCIAQATTIYVTSRDTLALLPPKHRVKARIELNIGSSDDDDGFDGGRSSAKRTKQSFRILYLGRFLHWKGMHLGIAAFSQLLQQQPEARLTMIGDGPERTRWWRLAERLGVAGNIDWQPWVQRNELGGVYNSHHVMLFPSLHDSGGMVVLESLACGVPVVCLKIGGPGTIVTDDCGRVVEAAGRSAAQVVAALARALIELTNEEERARLAEAGRRRYRRFGWRHLVARVYGEAD